MVGPPWHAIMLCLEAIGFFCFFVESLEAIVKPHDGPV